MSRIACCPHDGAPLIATFVWAKAEFYCLDCGRRYGWLSPTPGDGPALEAKLAEYQAEWDEHAGPHLRLIDSARFQDCPKCQEGQDHMEHLTDQERVADGEARAWLRKRVRS